MKIASLLAVVLAAAPACAAGYGRSGSFHTHAARAHAAHASRSRSTSGRNSSSFGSFSRMRFATRSSFGANSLRAPSFSSHARVSHFNSAGAAFSGNVPTNGGSTATRGPWGTPIIGTMNNSTSIGGPSGAGTQTVAAGAIALPSGALDVDRSPGVTWAAPDAKPSSGGKAGGNGATTNSPPFNGF